METSDLNEWTRRSRYVNESQDESQYQTEPMIYSSLLDFFSWTSMSIDLPWRTWSVGQVFARYASGAGIRFGDMAEDLTCRASIAKIHLSWKMVSKDHMRGLSLLHWDRPRSSQDSLAVGLRQYPSAHQILDRWMFYVLLKSAESLVGHFGRLNPRYQLLSYVFRTLKEEGW
jgi:hypothetical protein